MTDPNHDDERIRKIILEAQLLQAKRTIKAITFVTIAYFAIKGLITVYHYISQLF
ncbi:hypothetical protein [Ammoniphilus resinae]|uniref:Uncharacterized protein n=1 Tax=Ammoniphilus resinae TaxID=861532 RepID=A0ABS4GQ70_9BACL|nr:hypothetical protein [Ammoniphilus resinae]MBP1932414.1 hypothetical protein [Ammoniphilus resinae]